jgi:hypothetical protein
VGNTSQITYEWSRNGTNINIPNSYTFTEEAGLPVGTYTYSVTAKITQNGIMCSKLSTNYIITVAPPAPPSINASLVNCITSCNFLQVLDQQVLIVGAVLKWQYNTR